MEALPNEIVQSREGFEKLEGLLAEETKSGWSLKQVDSTWAQGYMIYTVVLQKPELGEDTQPTPALAVANNPAHEPAPAVPTIAVPEPSPTVTNTAVPRPAPTVATTMEFTSDEKKVQSEATIETNVPLIPSSSEGPRSAVWLAAVFGLGIGVLLVFLGLITAITTSDLMALGRSPIGGLLFPGLAFTTGLVFMIFTSYKIGEFTWRQKKRG